MLHIDAKWNDVRRTYLSSKGTQRLRKQYWIMSVALKLNVFKVFWCHAWCFTLICALRLIKWSCSADRRWGGPIGFHLFILFRVSFLNILIFEQPLQNSWIQPCSWKNPIDYVNISVLIKLSQYYSTIRSLYRHVVCNVPVSCKANGVKTIWLDSDRIVLIIDS